MKQDRTFSYDDGKTVSILLRSEAWKDLEAFFRRQLPFGVSITSLYYEGERENTLQVHTRLMKCAGRQFGIWDQREAETDDSRCEEIRVTIVTELLDDVLRDIHRLFLKPTAGNS
jgi:hypothetical protein